jgi:DNA-binding SARP family transcriptional activator
VIEFGVLGPLTIRRDGVAVVLPATLRRLTAVLLTSGRRAVPVDVLVTALWPDEPPPEPRKVVQVYVYRLRRALGAEVVTYDQSGYTLHATAADATRFETFVADATLAGASERASAMFARALELWRGSPYEGLTAGAPLAHEVGRLREKHVLAQEQWFEVQLELRRYADAIDGLTALVAEHPFREHARALLMLALYRTGRQVEALAVFREARAVFAAQIGIEPGERLRRLHEDILRQHADLWPVPRQVPAGVRGFIGRAAQLAALDGLLARAADHVTIAVVTGPAGIGKTALAVQWAHRTRFPDGQLYVDLRGFSRDGSPMSPKHALRGLLGALGVSARFGDLESLYRSTLAGRRLLVVLDNAYDTEQLRPLLPGAPGCFVVVTSRRQLPGLVVAHDASVVRLPVLTAAESRQLVAARMPGADPALTASLGERCGHLPLALAIVAARSQGVLPDSLDAFDLGQHSVRTALSWSCRVLSPLARQLLGLLGGRPAGEFTARTAVALAGVLASAALTELVQLHLVEESAPGRFGMHPLVHLYAAELAGGQRVPALAT